MNRSIITHSLLCLYYAHLFPYHCPTAFVLPLNTAPNFHILIWPTPILPVINSLSLPIILCYALSFLGLIVSLYCPWLLAIDCEYLLLALSLLPITCLAYSLYIAIRLNHHSLWCSIAMPLWEQCFISLMVSQLLHLHPLLYLNHYHSTSNWTQQQQKTYLLVVFPLARYLPPSLLWFVRFIVPPLSYWFPPSKGKSEPWLGISNRYCNQEQ